MRFLGNIEAKIDAKGRAFLPAIFRKTLLADGEEHIILRKDVFQPCLVLYPESVWNEQTDALRQRLNRWNKQHQQVFRQFVSEVEILTLDGNGRFLIPKRYQRMADMLAWGTPSRYGAPPKPKNTRCNPKPLELLLKS